MQAVSDLASLGALQFLVANLPILDPWAFTFNSVLGGGLTALDTGSPSIDILQFDAPSVLGGVTLNPAAFGFSNVTTPCLDTVNNTVCANPSQYLQWDSAHPTQAGHAVLAGAALALIPEPSSALLIGLGLSLMASRRGARRR